MRGALKSDVANYIVKETQKGEKDINNKDINNNFIAAFSSNYINKFIDHVTMISEKKKKYQFIIANTDSSSKQGTHWWSIPDIEPKADIVLFDSFGLDGLKAFIIQDDKKVIEKVLFGTEQMTKTDNKITLINIRFNLNACKNLSRKKELHALRDTASNFFHFI